MGAAQNGTVSVVLRRYGAGVMLPLLLSSVAVWVWGRAPAAADVVALTQSRTSPSPTAAASSAPARSPVPGTPARGPGITVPGVRLSVVPAPDGTLVVAEQVVLDRPVQSLTLQPPSLAPAGSRFADATPVATGVQLAVKGQPVAVDSGTVDRRLTIDLPQSATAFELRYVLTGAIVRSVPSLTGRALAAFAPLSAGDTSPVIVTTGGDSVRNVTCPLLDVDASACSDGLRGAMSVRDPLPRDRALVVLQLDLPRP